MEIHVCKQALSNLRKTEMLTDIFRLSSLCEISHHDHNSLHYTTERADAVRNTQQFIQTLADSMNANILKFGRINWGSYIE